MTDSWLRRLSLLMALSWMGLLFYLSHQQSLHAPSLFSGQDKLIHAVVYGALGVMLLAAQPLRSGRYSWRQIGASVLIASLYGASDELHQSFVPGRSAEVGDWIADTLGALIAALAVAWWVKNRRALKPATENKML
jgi:VanZ family protein